jgi:hypothetical protein
MVSSSTVLGSVTQPVMSTVLLVLAALRGKSAAMKNRP